MSQGKPQVLLGKGDNVTGSVDVFLQYETVNLSVLSAEPAPNLKMNKEKLSQGNISSLRQLLYVLIDVITQQMFRKQLLWIQLLLQPLWIQ